jgi:hypothetical protein
MCKYWDCGWCYAPTDEESNNCNGACNKPIECEQNKGED